MSSTAVVNYTISNFVTLNVLGVCPSGYRLIVRLPDKKHQTDSGIYVPDATVDKEHTASIMAQVIAVGPDAYADITKFPNGPWCKLGDWVMFRRYAGTRFKLDGHECRLLNDDSVEAVLTELERVEAI